MKWFRRQSIGLFLTVVLLATGQAWAQSQQKCLSYESTIVKLAGVIISRTFPGLPNYENIKEGDEPETYWLLALHAPVCVNGTPGDLVNESLLKQAYQFAQRNSPEDAIAATYAYYNGHKHWNAYKVGNSPVHNHVYGQWINRHGKPIYVEGYMDFYRQWGGK